MDKINKGLCVSTVFFALLSLVLAGSAIHLFQKNGDLKEKVKISSESKGTVPIYAPPKEDGAKGTVPVESRVVIPETTKYHEMKVLRFEYGTHNLIQLCLSEEPDMSVVKEYVTVDPAPEGGLSFSISHRYDY